jgi:hypothetical protein
MWRNVFTKEWDPAFISYLLEWLGYDGVAFFTLMLEQFGKLAPVIPTDGLPYAVHFREGMAVRNAMRRIHKQMGLGVYGSYFYDDNWQSAVKAALVMCEEGLTDEYKGLTEDKAGAGPAQNQP